MYEEEYLIHFGVRGMKWGRRKNNKASDNREQYSIKGKSGETLYLVRDKTPAITKVICLV